MPIRVKIEAVRILNRPWMIKEPDIGRWEIGESARYSDQMMPLHPEDEIRSIAIPERGRAMGR